MNVAKIIEGGDESLSIKLIACPKHLFHPLSEFRDCPLLYILLAVSDEYLYLKRELTIFLRHCQFHGKLQFVSPHER